MKNLLHTLLACSLLLSVPAFAAEEHTPLEKEMKDMNRSLRTLKRQVADSAKKADNLALVDKVKAAIDNAHKLDPSKTSEQADKAAYTAKYKDEMVALGKAVGELEMAIKVDKADDAKKALDKINDLKEKGHKDFGVDED